ncbi:MAG: ISKra4 family transposase [Prochloraceae cyanobacterium]
MNITSLTSIEQDPFQLAHEQYQLLVTTLSSIESQTWEHGQVETWLEHAGTELLRRLFQGHLELRAAQEQVQVEVIGSDAEPRPHRRQRQKRQLETLFGEVLVTRNGYSSKKSGVNALYPEDGKLNLAPDKYSDGVRRRVVIEASKVSFAETSNTLAETTGAMVGKRQCEELTVKVACDFEQFYAQRENNSPESTEELLVLTTDGKGIVMHQSDLREATAKAAPKSCQQKKTRLSPGQKRQRKRMATVASVYSTPRFKRRPEEIINEKKERPVRPAIHHKRVWASVRQDAKTIIDSCFAEALRRDPHQQREWVVLVDGEKHQLDTLKRTAKRQGVKVNIILDFIHVLEYLWKAAYCFFDSGSEEAEKWVAHRALRILSGKASNVAAGIRRSATLKKLSPKERENADKCANYLLKYRNYLHYDQYLSQGYPIASGVIEGTCRHLIKDHRRCACGERMDLTGARWRLARAEAVLRIRALRASGDFEEYWQYHKMKEFKRNHVSKFQNPEILLVA